MSNVSYCPGAPVPQTQLGGIHVVETRMRFKRGALRAAAVLCCPNLCITNLPKPRDTSVLGGVGASAMLVGSIVQGAHSYASSHLQYFYAYSHIQYSCG